MGRRKQRSLRLRWSQHLPPTWRTSLTRTMSAVLPAHQKCHRSWTRAFYRCERVTLGACNASGGGVRASRSNTSNIWWRCSNEHGTSWYGTTKYWILDNGEGIWTYTSWDLSVLGVSLVCLTWKMHPKCSGDPSPRHANQSMSVGDIT